MNSRTRAASSSEPYSGSSSSASQKDFTIAIIGGGIGGVSLAIGLAAQNVPFHIYEAAPSFGEIGAGVSFGPNVLRAIHGLSPAMLRAYARHVTANEDEALADVFATYRKGDDDQEGTPQTAAKEIFSLQGKVQEIDGMRFPVRCCVHRAHLLGEWVRLLPPGSATFGKALVRIQQAGDEPGPVHLTFADGSTAAAAAVVGCDGIKSVTRTLLPGGSPEETEARRTTAASYAGFFGYRAMAPRAAFARTLGPALAASGNLFLCPDGYTITYPVDHGVALNMFATCLQPPGTTWTDAEWKVPSSAQEMRRDLAGRHPGVVDLLVRHGNGEKWAMFHYPHDLPYFHGRICIAGDAAHATTPHLGAGAGMAIEDAFVLSRLLGSIQHAQDIAKAFEAYDAVRRRRSQKVVRESAQNVARYCAISCAEGEELARFKNEMHQVNGWLWDHDIANSLSEAIHLMEENKSERLPTRL